MNVILDAYPALFLLRCFRCLPEAGISLVRADRTLLESVPSYSALTKQHEHVCTYIMQNLEHHCRISDSDVHIFKHLMIPYFRRKYQSLDPFACHFFSDTVEQDAFLQLNFRASEHYLAGPNVSASNSQDLGFRILIPSPEYMLVRTAARIQLLLNRAKKRLTKDGYRILRLRLYAIMLAIIGELCGTYAHSPSSMLDVASDMQSCSFNAAPLTRKKHILDFCHSHTHIKGVTLLEEACGHALEHAASPFELYLATVFHLPRRLGGLGIEDIELNKSLELKKELRGRYQKKSIVPDISFPQLGCVLECDSTSFHASSRDVLNDRIKAQIYSLLHMQYIPVAYDQISQADKLNRFLRSFVDMTGDQLLRWQRKSMRDAINNRTYTGLRRELAWSILHGRAQREHDMWTGK